MNITKLATMFASCALVAVCSATLVSCGPADEQREQTPEQLDRAYMSQVNALSMQATSSLASFAEALAANDIAGMKSAAASASAKYDELSNVEAPDGMGDVAKEYQAGIKDITSALNEYISAYAEREAKDSTVSDSAYASTLADIQRLYDSGVKHLSDADEQAAKALESASTQ